jgi:hypothetical protein
VIERDYPREKKGEYSFFGLGFFYLTAQHSANALIESSNYDVEDGVD